MKFRQWSDKDSDSDDYDRDKTTSQVIMLDTDGKISAGMRLTPRPSIQETKSWKMLDGITDEHALGIDGGVWDLTRLVPGKRMDGGIKSMQAFAELFGAAFAQHYDIDKNPHWIFATDAHFVKVFENYGIKFTVIPDTERGDYALYHAFPAELTQFLVDNKDKFKSAYQSVARGIERTISSRNINGPNIN